MGKTHDQRQNSNLDRFRIESLFLLIYCPRKNQRIRISIGFAPFRSEDGICILRSLCQCHHLPFLNLTNFNDIFSILSVRAF